MGLVHAWQAAAPLLLVVTLALTLPVISVSWRELARAILPSAAGALVMAAAVAFAERRIADLPPPVELAILVAMGIGLYLLLMWRFARPTIDALYTFVTRKQLSTV